MPCRFCGQEHAYSVEEALERLSRGPSLLREALSGASEAELRFAEPKPGGWTPLQVAAHVMDTEMIWGVRWRQILSEDQPALPTMDQNRWAEAVTAGRDVNDIVGAFELLRRQNVALLSRAAAAGALDRSGTHAEFGRLSMRDMLMHGSDHDAKHAAQIRRIRAALSPR